MLHRFKTLLPLLAFCLLLPIHAETSTFSKKISKTYKRYCALPLQYRILIPVIAAGTCFCIYKYFLTPPTPVEKPVDVEFLSTLVQPTSIPITIQPNADSRSYRIGGTNLIIHNRLKIEKAQTVAIVNAANGRILGTGGVAKAIQNKIPYRAAYNAEVAQIRQYARQSQGFKTFPSGSAIIMPSHYAQESPIAWIIHAVGPQSKEVNVPNKLYSAYFNSLQLASNKGLHSIMFPLLSSAIFGVSDPNPKSHLNPIMPALKALSDFFAQNPHTSIQEVHFTLFPAMSEDKTTIITDWHQVFIDALNGVSGV